MPTIFLRGMLSVALVALTAGAAMAADDAATPMTDQRGSVVDRARPAYDAVGIRAGGFTVFPQATLGGIYDDNIYATDVNETDDFITTLGTSVAVNSNWSRHALNFNASVKQYLYTDNDDEDRLDWNVGANGVVDVTRNTQFAGGLSYAQLHEDRGDPSAPTAAKEPTEYSLFSGNASALQRFNRLSVKLAGEYNDYDYDDVENTIGGIIDQDGRDRVETLESLRFGYDVTPDTNIYVQAGLNQREYDLQPPAVATNRNSDGYDAVIGSDFRLGALFQGGIYGGYQEQKYDSALYPSIDGPSYGANIEWYVTPMTTLTFDADASIQETTSAGASGYFSQSFGVRVDHELVRNILLNARVSYSDDEYEGIARSDDTLRGGLGLDYLVNRNFTLGVDYDYTDKDSDQIGSDYKRNKIGLTLTGKL